MIPIPLRPSTPAALLGLGLSLGLPLAAVASGGHGGLPTPTVELETEEVVLPFVLSEEFPVPVVEVRLNGGSVRRLAVDTAMGGTILLRREVAVAMGLPVVGRAMVADSSDAPPRPADLIRIEEMTVGGLRARDILGIGFAADAAHLDGVPDDLDGILGNLIYAELLTTIDYPERRLVFGYGALDPDTPGTVGYEEKGKVMVLDLEIGGSTVEVTLDSGHRDSITLRRSLASRLPLAGRLQKIDNLSTVSATYQREVSRLDGEAVLAGIRLLDPELVFSSEDTPQLVGFGVLGHFAITIDQKTRRLRFTPRSEPPIEGIDILR